MALQVGAGSSQNEAGTCSRIDTPATQAGSPIVHGWQPIETAPAHEEVWTKIDDEHGERNVAKLTRKGRLWFTEPSGGMYVYYTPTHWRRP